MAGAAVPPIDVNDNGQADADEVLETKAAAVKAVASGTYPSPPARIENLVTKGKPSGLALDFHAVGVDRRAEVPEEVGFVPLTPEQVKAGQDKLK